MTITLTKKYRPQIDVFPCPEKARAYLEREPLAQEVTAKEAVKLNSSCLYHYQDKAGNWCYSIYKTRAAIKAAS